VAGITCFGAKPALCGKKNRRARKLKTSSISSIEAYFKKQYYALKRLLINVAFRITKGQSNPISSFFRMSETVPTIVVLSNLDRTELETSNTSPMSSHDV
jgi:hypothetical protein